MRPVRTLTGLALWLAFGLLALAQEAGPSDLRLEADETKVYSHPGAGSLITGVLRRGGAVKVYRQMEGGWLEIAPPAGSFCWINNRFVDGVGASLRVVGQAPVKLRVGSVLSPNQPTNVETVPVPVGTQFYALSARPVSAEGSNWWRVEPSQRERRYIQVPASSGAVVSSGPAPKGPPAVPVSRPAPATPTDTDALWRQAQEADRTGHLGEAERLYAELARVSHDESLRILALNRAQFLRDSMRTQQRNPQVRPEPGRPAPQTPLPYQPATQPRAMPGKAASPTYPIGTAPPTGLDSTAPPNVPLRSGPGRLERTRFSVDARPAFALVSSQGLRLMYVTAQDGVNLDAYVNRNVELVGPVVYHGVLRSNYMRVAQVIPLQ